MESVNYTQLINFITHKDGNFDTELSIGQVKDLVNSVIEMKTGCKVYNKSQLLEEINQKLSENPNLLKSIMKESISKNLIPEISFNTLFKSNLDFTIVFNKDQVNILYKNNLVEKSEFGKIKEDLIKNKLNYLPEITELYVDNIIRVIDKFMNKDLSVKYYCVDIPVPYWKLFEIKCKKSNHQAEKVYSEYKSIENVINGKIYEKEPVNNIQVINQDEEPDPEMKLILMQIEELENKEKNIKSLNNKELTAKEKKDLDDQYRMEIMSYLNDNEVMLFLEKLEQIDNQEKNPNYNDKNYFIETIKMLLDTISVPTNKMIKFYFVNRMFNFIILNENFLTEHDNFRKTVKAKIEEINDDIYIIQTAGLAFSNEITNTFSKSMELIDNIEKKLNPNYQSKWSITTQQTIINQLNNNMTKTNNNFNQQNNKYDDDEEMSDIEENEVLSDIE